MLAGLLQKVYEIISRLAQIADPVRGGRDVGCSRMPEVRGRDAVFIIIISFVSCTLSRVYLEEKPHENILPQNGYFSKRFRVDI